MKELNKEEQMTNGKSNRQVPSMVIQLQSNFTRGSTRAGLSTNASISRNRTANYMGGNGNRQRIGLGTANTYSGGIPTNKSFTHTQTSFFNHRNQQRINTTVGSSKI